jgi:hypothetical protein
VSAEQDHSMLGAKRDPEPVLPELLRSAWRRSGIAVRVALVLLVVAAVAIAAWLAFGRGGGSFTYEGGEAPPFSLTWGSEMERIESGENDLLRLATPGVEDGDGQYLAVQPLPPTAAEAAKEDEPLPGLAIAAGEGLGDDARVVLEGRTELAVDRGPEAYQVAFTGPAGFDQDGILIAKRFLVPDPDRPGEGVAIEIGEVTTNPRVAEKVEDAPAGFFLNWPIQLLLEDAASVRTGEGLEQPLRSFAFG